MALLALSVIKKIKYWGQKYIAYKQYNYMYIACHCHQLTLVSYKKICKFTVSARQCCNTCTIKEINCNCRVEFYEVPP